jgi:hypothetical protein
MAELFNVARAYGIFLVVGDGIGLINPIHGAKSISSLAAR